MKKIRYMYNNEALSTLMCFRLNSLNRPSVHTNTVHFLQMHISLETLSKVNKNKNASYFYDDSRICIKMKQWWKYHWHVTTPYDTNTMSSGIFNHFSKDSWRSFVNNRLDTDQLMHFWWNVTGYFWKCVSVDRI